MDCPICHAPLERLNEGRIAVDRCGACRAFFFDPGELAGFSGDRYREAELVVKARAGAGGVGATPCPRCGAILSSFGPHEAPLDVCTGCGGLFVGEQQLARWAVSTAMEQGDTEAGARAKELQLRLGRAEWRQVADSAAAQALEEDELRDAREAWRSLLEWLEGALLRMR